MLKVTAILGCLFFACNWAMARDNAMRMQASWYSMKSLKREGTYAKSGGITASGDMFQEEGLTAASWDYPLGSRVRVKHGKKAITVRVNDRTARRFKGKRIDLSKGAFRSLADLERGIIDVEVTKL